MRSARARQCEQVQGPWCEKHVTLELASGTVHRSLHMGSRDSGAISGGCKACSYGRVGWACRRCRDVEMID